MTSYYLNYDCLNNIAIFQGLHGNGGTATNEKKIASFRNILKQALEEQPELIHDFKQFEKQVENEKYLNNLFARIFDGKIKVENILQPLLNVRHLFRGETKNVTSTFKFIFDEYPPFLNLMHDYIVNTPYVDTILIETYFDLLKSKKADKSNISPNEILKNIGRYALADTSISFKKRKINTYLVNFPKDERLYNHIMEIMNTDIKEKAEVKNYWEEKLHLFPKHIQELYKNSTNNISPFIEEELFSYYFTLNSQYIIQQEKIPEKLAKDITNSFCWCLTSFINDHFKSKSARHDTIEKIIVTFDTEEQREEVKKFCNAVMSELDSALSSIISLKGNMESSTIIERYLEQSYLKHTLNNSPSSENPKKRNKI